MLQYQSQVKSIDNVSETNQKNRPVDRWRRFNYDIIPGGAAVRIAVQTTVRIAGQCPTGRGREGSGRFPGFAGYASEMSVVAGPGRFVLRPIAGGDDADQIGVAQRAGPEPAAEDRYKELRVELFSDEAQVVQLRRAGVGDVVREDIQSWLVRYV